MHIKAVTAVKSLASMRLSIGPAANGVNQMLLDDISETASHGVENIDKNIRVFIECVMISERFI